MDRDGLARSRRAFLLALWIGLLTLMLVAPAAAADPTAPREERVLRFGLLPDFPPFQIWPAGGQPGGADLQLLQVLAKRLDMQVQPVRYEDQRTLERDLLQGRLDVAGSMARTPTREASMEFTRPYAVIRQAFVTRLDETSATMAPDLGGRTIAVVAGYASQERARRMFPLAPYVEVRSIVEALQAVSQGRADVALEALPGVLATIERARIQNLRIARTLELPTGQLHFVTARGAAGGLAGSLSAAIEAVGDAERAAIVRQWSAQATFVSQGGGFSLSETERAQLAALGPVVVGVAGRHPPFIVPTRSASPTGFSVEVLRATLGRLGLTVGEWRRGTPDEILQGLRTGQIQFAVGVPESHATADAARFVGPFITFPMVLLGPRRSTGWDLEQMSGRALALPEEYFARALISARYPGIRLTPCPDLPSCVDVVERGRAQAVLADLAAASAWLGDMPDSEMQLLGSASDLRFEQSVALSRAEQWMAPIVLRALDTVGTDEMVALKARWLARPPPSQVATQTLIRAGTWAAGVLALLALAWWVHNRRLHAEMLRTEAARALAEEHRATAEGFVTFLAHEVRNSLHSVIAGTDLMPKGEPAIAQVASSIRSSSRATLQLLNNLLDRSRMDAGRLVLHVEPARLTPVLLSVADEMTPAARARQMQLRHDLAVLDPLLNIDAMRVQQIVRNLVSNAIKYADPGPIRLTSKCTRLAGTPLRFDVEVSVADQGPGLTPEEQAHLFETFYIGAREGSQSASGLGLGLCRDLAQLMGGELTFQTDPGVGTTVSLRWQPEAVGEPERTVVSAGERKRAGGRLLVVEDEPVYAMLLERVLCDEGFDVQLADSLSSVGELMDGGHIFDGVLTDQNLPDADARQVIERVSRRAAWGSPPCAVAVMSADIEEASVAALRAEGVQVFLSKTADVRWLVSQLLHHPAWAQVKAVDDAEPVSARLLSDHDSSGIGRL